MALSNKLTKEEYFALQARKPKYHNKLVRDALGNVLNHSKKEAKMANDFYLELKAGKYLEVQEQYKIQLFVNYTHVCDIIVDFYIKHLDGSVELVECKSEATRTPVWKLKWRLLHALFPMYRLTVII